MHQATYDAQPLHHVIVGKAQAPTRQISPTVLRSDARVAVTTCRTYGRCLPNVSRLIAIQRPTQPSDRLNVPEPVFPDNCPTAVRVMPFPAPTECNVPSGSTCPLPPLMMILPPTILAGSEPV